MDKEWTYESIYAQCEALGEDEVQARLDENSWFGGREIAAKQWLRKRQRDRVAEEAAETRKIAQQANDIAQRANWIAVAAVIVSAMVSLIVWWKT